MNKQTHRPDLKLCSTVGLEEHCLGSKGAASPLDNVAVQLKEELISTNPDILVENEEPGRVMFVNLQFLLQDGHRPQVKLHLMKQLVISRRAHICHKYHKLYLFEFELSCGEILGNFGEILGNFGKV